MEVSVYLVWFLLLELHNTLKTFLFFYEIAEFLSNLPYNPAIGPELDVLNTKPRPRVEARHNNMMAYLTVKDPSLLYNYILPFFKSLEFKSRKAVDFQLWEAAVKLRALGYTTSAKPKEYFIAISKYINKRYSTNVGLRPMTPEMVEILKLFNRPPVYNLASGLSYRAYSDINRKAKGLTGYSVNVYDNGKLVEGSPFPSYTQAALALGNINISSAISKKINTDKLYKQRFKFESTVNSDTTN